MALRIRRGLDSQRTTIIFENGEPIWVTDTGKLYIGDNSTLGAKSIIENYAGPGLTYNATEDWLESEAVTVNSDDVIEGTNKLFFTSLRAQNATAALFQAGTHTNISYVYDDVTHRIDSSVTIPTETVQDAVAPMFVNGIHSGVTFSYDDFNNRINAAVSVNVEDIQDTIGEMFNNGNHIGIAVDYEDQYNRLSLSLITDSVEDIVGLKLINATKQGLNIFYSTTTNDLTFEVVPEYIEDATARMFTDGLHPGIEIEYNDANPLSTIDISLDDNYITDLVGLFISSGIYSGINNSYDALTNSLTLDLDDLYVKSLVESMFTLATHVGISASYDALTETVVLTNTHVLLDEATPELGGDLTLGGFNIVGNGNIQIYGNIDNFGTISSGSLTVYDGINSSALLSLKGDHTAIYNPTDGTTTNPGWTSISAYKGTFETPVNLAAGDVASSLLFKSYFADDYYLNAAITVTLDSDAALVTTGDPDGVPSKLEIYLKSNNATGNVTYGFSSKGVFNAPILQPGVYADVAARDAAIPYPAIGYMVFLIDGGIGNPKFMGCTNAGSGIIGQPGYVAPTWVDLN